MSRSFVNFWQCHHDNSALHCPNQWLIMRLEPYMHTVHCPHLCIYTWLLSRFRLFQPTNCNQHQLSNLHIPLPPIFLNLANSMAAWASDFFIPFTSWSWHSSHFHRVQISWMISPLVHPYLGWLSPNVTVGRAMAKKGQWKLSAHNFLDRPLHYRKNSSALRWMATLFALIPWNWLSSLWM